MNISVAVIDGIHGYPAEGVEVTLVRHLEGVETERIRRRTNQWGQVSYRDFLVGNGPGETHHVEIDAHIYFATLGIDCWQRRVAIFFHPVDPDDEYFITSLLTPCMQSTYCMRQRDP
jgi:5-hydroxyisourate hydrolase-like protein (transthyretin family)